jgi:hypothetical protein
LGFFGVAPPPKNHPTPRIFEKIPLKDLWVWLAILPANHTHMFSG